MKLNRKINLPFKACASMIDYEAWVRNSVPSAEVHGYEFIPYKKMEHRVRDYRAEIRKNR